MRVVLMGRTMAGKSSLLTALTGSHFDRIGDGRQRFSRDVFGAATAASDRLEIVDTPGVGAHRGADDTEVALEAALDADLIVWVNSNDSIQEESAAALRLLGVIGKPIIVALNCRQSLEGVGRINLLRFPDRVFGSKEGLVDEIKRHMAEAGAEPLDVVYVHALAATEALAKAEIDAELRAASRIDSLTKALIQEHTTHSESRRAIRLVDGPRRHAEELALSLQNGSTTLDAHAERDMSMTNDVHARLARVVRSTGEAMVSDVEAAVGRRRDWHLTVTDFGKSLQSDWEGEVSALQEELRKTLESRLTSLTTEVESTIADINAEWTSVPAEQSALRDLTRFDQVWGNRLIRAGVGIGGALAVMGVGALIGGPIGLMVALVGSPVAGVALTPLKGLVDRIFLGKGGVLRKRRTEVAKQVGPILDDLTHEYEKAISGQLNEFRNTLANERARSDERSASLHRLSRRWTQHRDTLNALIRELDRETTSALLRIARRERLARSVKRATRVPGVGILAELENSAFWEVWLYPPDIGEKLAGGKPPSAGHEATSALSYTLGLVDAPASLVMAGSTSATLRIDADIPGAITETWADALTDHIGKHIQIETTRRTSKA
jgi:gas vesicle protein